jgi:hypothetical protein
MKPIPYNPDELAQAISMAQQAANESGERTWLIRREDSGTFYTVPDSRFRGANSKTQAIEKLVYPAAS